MPIDACLVDTNVLLRIPKLSGPNYVAVDTALAKLATPGHDPLLHPPEHR